VPAVLVDTSGPVCRIRLNRPEKLNALNEDVRRGLSQAFSRLADDPAVRVAVVEGAGRSFSAGADLASFGGGGPEAWAERRHAAGAWQRVLDLVESVPQVTVARLHGHVVGGAALIAVSCDLRIAADDLKVFIPELAIGIPLTWGGVPRLIREVGLPMARDLVMTGRELGAQEALACGLVQRVAPRDHLDDVVDVVVAKLLDMPAGPLSLTRAMFAALTREGLGAAAWSDSDVLAWSLREPEGRAAAAEYVRKRLERSD
jgi:enoyl-CoA hydratase/carnithine racemase